MFRKDTYNHVYDGPAPMGSVALEMHGHYVLRQEFTAAEVDRLRASVLEVYREHPPDPREGRITPTDAAQYRYEMFNRSAVCQEVIARPAVLAILEPLLGSDCHVISCTAWHNPPGLDGRANKWHTDGGPHVPRPAHVPWPPRVPYPIFIVTTHVYLQDVGLDDGPTHVIPGSHTSGQPVPADRVWDPDLRYLGRTSELHLARAGDVGFFVSDVWHRRCPSNERSVGRLFLQTCYGRRDIAPRLRPPDEISHARPAAIARATDLRSRQLIGLHCQTFYDS